MPPVNLAPVSTDAANLAVDVHHTGIDVSCPRPRTRDLPMSNATLMPPVTPVAFKRRARPRHRQVYGRLLHPVRHRIERIPRTLGESADVLRRPADRLERAPNLRHRILDRRLNLRHVRRQPVSEIRQIRQQPADRPGSPRTHDRGAASSPQRSSRRTRREPADLLLQQPRMLAWSFARFSPSRCREIPISFSARVLPQQRLTDRRPADTMSLPSSPRSPRPAASSLPQLLAGQRTPPTATA